jgi:protein-disulfide isomerase
MEIPSMRPSKTLLAALLVMVAALPVCAKKERKADAAAPGSQPASAAVSGAPDEVVATIGDQSITRSEIDKQAASKLSQVRQQEYDIRRGTLEKMLQDKLYAKEAAARGVSVEDLVKTEVDQKVAAPTDQEVSKFYEENKPRMGGRTLEQVSGDIKNFLQQQKSQGRRREFFQEMMAKEKAVILLDPPRSTVALRDNELARGPVTAPVTIVEYSDFQCPFCKRAQAIVDEVVKSYGDKVRLVYRDYPLQFHPQALPAANAARCAGDQGKYWEYHHNLMSVEGSLMDDDLKKRATDVGLDATKFNACLEAKPYEQAIMASFEEGSALGVTGTPTFFINGRMMVGAKSAEDLKMMIDEELARAARQAGSGQSRG